MDDNGATHLCDLLAPSGSSIVASPRTDQPTYLIVISGGIPGAMLRLRHAAHTLGLVSNTRS